MTVGMDIYQALDGAALRLTPARPGCRRAHWLAASAAGATDARGPALIEHCSVGAGPSTASVGSAASAGGGVAHYRCRLLSDSGPPLGVDPEHTPALMIVAFDVPEGLRVEVDRWYAEEHIPLLLQVPGWLRAQRYECVSYQGGPRYTSIALHELAELAVLDSPERSAARNTPWRARFASLPWFVASGRFVYTRNIGE